MVGSSVEITSQNYENEVITKSYQQPVLVDFFATWCGPCQILKPILESLLKEYDFVLAKVDIDQNNDLANQFGVEGVPDVRMVIQGQMFPGFVGVLPEPKLREFFGKFGLKSKLELQLDQIRLAKQAGNLSEVKELFDQLFFQYPDHPIVAIEAAKFLLNLKQPETAAKMLDTVEIEHPEDYQKAQSLKTLISLIQDSEPSGDQELDQKLNQAVNFVFNEDYEPALNLFLEIVETSRKYKNDGARKAMVAIFTLLGDHHSLTKTYQPKLMLALY